MPKYEPTVAKLIEDGTGEEIPPGAEVTDFRGEKTTFCYVSRLPGGASEGKIIVSDTPDDPLSGREFYPRVFGARIEICGTPQG